ncbi:hypothetical protein [Shewanella colwelliana]|uniref:hypothetical protein n=1 Tax=Shewanella colwelliana TaxID=23 RepID=UPI0022AECBF7|nr:hypothetical protein [Shewanella colwelliana]MCZ4338868.1 hypothetical protein [Shewanella colwelliana]
MTFIGSHQVIGSSRACELSDLQTCNSVYSSPTQMHLTAPQCLPHLGLLLIGIFMVLMMGCDQSPSKKLLTESPKSIEQASPQATTVASVNALTKEYHQYWQLAEQGIRWQVGQPHSDQLEMSGLQISAVINYGVDETGNTALSRTLVWPMLRTLPNDTHASLIRTFSTSVMPQLTLDGEVVTNRGLVEVIFDGVLTLTQQLTKDVSLVRTLTIHPNEPGFIERWQITNLGEQPVLAVLTETDYQEITLAENGQYGRYKIAVNASAKSQVITPNSHLVSDIVFSAQLADEMVYIDPTEAIAIRHRQLDGWRNTLQFESPDPLLNQMFEFAKLRATESIFATRNGLAHGPGGTRYYAAVWANDQAEYINPFFPYLGDAKGVASALNSFEWFANYMNPEFSALPSSIIAEGTDFWNGAGDRGDCAMIAYGASDFALSLGQEDKARELLPLIEWCLEYNRHQRMENGIIASDSDELEGRFPAGNANLSTNMLAYGGLVRAARLKKALGDDDQGLEQEAQALKLAIIAHFSAEIGGYQTYRYYEGNDKLRAWIALPLAFGFEHHKAGTIDALLSENLWTKDGLLTEEGDKTFWDRSTLYGFRALMKAGELQRVWPYFEYYSHKRLTGEHVPYAVEAWPEGDQRHLSAESGLYARVITEGLFGIEPMGFQQFTLAPRLPAHWNDMALRHIMAFGADFDIVVRRVEGGVNIDIVSAGRVIQQHFWDQGLPLQVTLTLTQP